jgi:ferrous iron transport protein A
LQSIRNNCPSLRRSGLLSVLASPGFAALTRCLPVRVAPIAVSTGAGAGATDADVDADVSGTVTSLGQLPAGSCATILSLAADHRLLQRFDALGLRPGQRVEVLRRGWISGILHLRVGMTELMLRRTGALAILVSPVAP